MAVSGLILSEKHRSLIVLLAIYNNYVQDKVHENLQCANKVAEGYILIAVSFMSLNETMCMRSSGTSV